MSKDLQLKQQMDAMAKQGGVVDTDAEHDPQTSRRASNAGLNREVQRKADGKAGGDVQSMADQGVRGGGAPLPHLDQIQRSFGQHDVSGVQAHTGPEASQAAQGMGAQAFATGNNVAFAGQPDLHTAAHEAAHVVQQRQGVQLKGGVGASGDAYEQQADQVADRVVAGKPAGDLLGAPKNNAGPAQAGPVQMKPGGKDIKTDEPKKAPTDADKANEKGKAEHETSDALQASMALATKQIHSAADKIDHSLTTGTDAGDEVRWPVIKAEFENARLAALHVSSVATRSDSLLEDQNYRNLRGPDFNAVWGAFEHFHTAMDAANKYAAKQPGGSAALGNLNPLFVSAELDRLKTVFGGNYAAHKADKTDPTGTVDTATMAAVKAHAGAALEAARALHMGVPNEADRFKMHVRKCACC